MAGDADDGSRYFNPDWPEVEIGPDCWKNVINRNYNHGEAQSETVDGHAAANGTRTYVIMNYQVTEDETPNVVEVDHSSTGSTCNSKQGLAGDTLYNPIHVTVAYENNGGNDQHEQTFMAKERRLSVGGEGGQNSYIHVTDDSDIRAVTTPMGIERLIIDGSSSKIVGYQGAVVGANNPDVVNFGMIFKCREDFKHHMAMYAIRKKFRFQNSRSAPVNLARSCNVDDRSGYQSQAIHTVIGG
ncbi:hypothetical protein YC2023_018801 [Brassica napus]